MNAQKMQKKGLLRAALIDDEPSARSITHRLLANHFSDSIAVVGEAASVSEGKKLIENAQPDLVFLDIDMPDGTGFDFLKQWEAVPFQVIFITAFDRFAVQAFRCAAVDYLLKPLDPAQFRLGLDRFLSARKSVETVQLDALRATFSKNKPEKIFVPHLTGFYVVTLKELLRIESHGNYCYFFIKNRSKITSSRPISVYEEMLPDDFLRVHQSHIVNTSEVIGFFGGEQATVQLSNDDKVPIARRRRTDLEDVLRSKMFVGSNF